VTDPADPPRPSSPGSDDPTRPADAPPPSGGYPPPSGGYPSPADSGYPPPPGDAQPTQPLGNYPTQPLGNYPTQPVGGSAQPPQTYPGGYQSAPPAPAGGTPYGALTLPAGTQLSSIGKRVGAWFLGIGLFIITLAIGYIVWALIVWARGQTPEKQILHMRVYRIEDRRAASWGWMFVRQILGGIVEGIIPAGLVVSFVVMCVSSERRAIHDYIAGTVVLDDPGDLLAPR
jgi:uncharacterized RDD family membrane protein YckC